MNPAFECLTDRYAAITVDKKYFTGTQIAFLKKAMANNVNLRRKALFHSPVPGSGPSDRSVGDNMLLLSARIHFEQEVESGQLDFLKGLHEQRLKKLRKKLEAFAQDDWKYPAIESLIGLK